MQRIQGLLGQTPQRDFDVDEMHSGQCDCNALGLQAVCSGAVAGNAEGLGVPWIEAQTMDCDFEA